MKGIATVEITGGTTSDIKYSISARALNMASGVLGVPIHLFFLSVLIGLMPYNYLCVTSGAILSEINDLADIVSWSNMAR